MLNNLIRSRFFGILLVIVMLLPCLPVIPAIAADSYPCTTGDTEVSDALAYLRGQVDSDGKMSDFATSAWAIMAIAAAGDDPHDWADGSNPSIVDYLAANVGSATTTNDYSRMILAIAAADEDPASFSGTDFVSLLESAYDGTQIGDSSLLNDDFWGVMALVAAGKDAATSTTLQGSVTFILSNQNANGGWSWGTGQDSDVDDTAAAIMALMAAGQDAAATPITEALAYIKTNQDATGGFLSWGSTNSATDAWAIAGIAAAGQDPTAAGWDNNDSSKDPVDDLLTFQNADGSFNWTPATPSNMALMTSYAIVALMGTPYPVAVYTAEPTPVTIDVRIEGQTDTIWSGTVSVGESTVIDNGDVSHTLEQPTALGALDEASQAGGFPYVVQDSAYGLYISSIDNEDAAGLAGWMYRVDGYSPWVGAADFILDETTPPATPHGEVLFAYSEWGQTPLQVAVSDTTLYTGDTFTVTVTAYADNTDTWVLVPGATVHAGDQDYTTGDDGTADITINDAQTLIVYAEGDGYIRSNKVTVTVTTYVPYVPSTAATVGVRIEGQTNTVWNGTVTDSGSTITDDGGTAHVLSQATVLGALDKASRAGSFNYIVKNTSYGLYVYSINGEEPAGLSGWMYWVDYYSPAIGAASFILNQTTPPATPHGEILFAYAAYGQQLLKVAVSDTIPGIGETFTVTVTAYTGTTWIPVSGATVHAGSDYTTGNDGTVDITVNESGTVTVYAEKANYIRSKKVTVAVTGDAIVTTTTTTVPATTTTTALAPLSGTAVSSADGNATVTIPDGVTGQTAGGDTVTQITITPMTNPPAPPTDMAAVGLYYEIEPSGATFSGNITITLSYDPGLVPDGSTPYIAWWNAATGMWEQLTTVSIDPVNHTITASVDHFSIFGVLAPEAKPITPPQVTTTAVPTVTTTTAVVLPKDTHTTTTTATAAASPTPEPATGTTSPVNWTIIGIIVGLAIVIGIVTTVIIRRRTVKK